MGTKFDKQTNTWMAFYSKRHPLTRQPVGLRRIKIPTKSQALRVEKELVIQVEEKIRKTILPSWSDHLTNFFDWMKERDYAEKTIKSYRTCLEAHTEEEWGTRLIDTITTQEVRELINRRVGHRSTSHQANLLKFIKAVFKYAVDVGYIDHAPIPHMKFKAKDKIKLVLTKPQVAKLLDTAKSLDCEWYPHWAMAVYTGMRNGELYALTWDKVNLEDRQMLVNCSWNNVDGFKDTKSGDDRMVEIAPNLIHILRELKIQNFDSPYVLPRIRKWDKGEQARELRMFLMGMGLPPIRFHDLRATWATIMLSDNVPPIKVMYMGGWKDLKTMQIYIRKAGVSIRGITDNLDLHNPVDKAGTVLDLRVSNKDD